MSAARRRFVTPKKPPYYLASALFFSLSGTVQASADCNKTGNSPRCEDSVTVEASTQPQSPYGGLNTVTQTASRLGLTRQETPRSVDVISKQAIEQRGDRTLAEVVEHAPGMSGVASPTLSNDFSLRGFRPVSWLYNGVETPGSTLQLADPSHYDGVEVLRGPGSVLNGLSAAGGSVNLISRQPTFSRQPVELDYGLSSYNSQRLHFGSGERCWMTWRLIGWMLAVATAAPMCNMSATNRNGCPAPCCLS
ncbi:Ferripyoverdine receptor precursor [Serratia quinivorans]|uniref:Ferripyoverdine receptor n=1 Tax=Serratia quinivorans TaxID=137545 RepID=A0A379YR14_9GAMM|nr:Ferripyoverdine receptor precursor [Serratia quinivorans]